MAIVAVEDTMLKTFYEINSYIYIFEDRVHLKNLVAVFDFKFSLNFAIRSYLHSSFLGEKLEDSAFEKILKIIVINNDQLEAIKNVEKIKV